MSLLARLALLFVVVPILELALLIKMGQVVGFLPTLMLVILTGVGGAALARAEGLRTILTFRDQLSQGQLPGQALLDGVSILLGGAFLLTPGLLTDVAGLSLLVPWTRRMIQRRVRASLERGMREGTIHFTVVGSVRPPHHPPGEPDIDEADYEVLDSTAHDGETVDSESPGTSDP